MFDDLRARLADRRIDAGGHRRRARSSPSRASTRCTAPGRCAASSPARSRPGSAARCSRRRPDGAVIRVGRRRRRARRHLREPGGGRHERAAMHGRARSARTAARRTGSPRPPTGVPRAATATSRCPGSPTRATTTSPRSRSAARSRCWSTCGRPGAGRAGWSAPRWNSSPATWPAGSSWSRSTWTRRRSCPQRFDVQAVPTLLLMDRGRVVARQLGAAPAWRPEVVAGAPTRGRSCSVTQRRNGRDGAPGGAASDETPDRWRRLPAVGRRPDRPPGGERRTAGRPHRSSCSSRRGSGTATSSSCSPERSRSSRAAARRRSRRSGYTARAASSDELGLLTGQPSFVSMVVREPGEILAVPLPRLRDLVSREPQLGDLILRAFLIRRELLIGLGAGHAHRRLALLAGHPQAARVRRPQPAAAPLDRPGAGPARGGAAAPARHPARRHPGGDLARTRSCATPTTPSWPAPLGLRRPPHRTRLDDLVVVGAGPAGLAAAVYGASEGLRDSGPRRRGHRRPGRHLVADRELPRVPQPASPAPNWPSGP